MKRALTFSERQEIIDACLREYGFLARVPVAMRDRFKSEFAQWLHRDLSAVRIYPDGIVRLREKMIQRYRLVESAKSVGIVCGQSIGEMQTQTTLNTFHKTGLTEKLVVAGVPRFLEIIDTNRSETQGTPSSYVYFKEPVPRTIADIRRIVGHSLVHFTLSGLISNWSIVETETQVYIRYTFKLDVLFRYKLHVQTIAEILLRAFPAYTVEASPLHLAYIDVYPGRQMEHAYEMEDVVHPQLLEVPICGIERIQNIFFMRAPDQSWYIETDGSNLEAVLNLAYVDSYRTYSNDIWEIYALFGIEAVRAYIIEELTALMPTIHPSHITLLADRMTVSGRLRSISRYTRKHEQSSVLSKATFEETLSGFLRSAIMNEVDTVNGSSASIICGKIPKVGSGMNDLVL